MAHRCRVRLKHDAYRLTGGYYEGEVLWLEMNLKSSGDCLARCAFKSDLLRKFTEIASDAPSGSLTRIGTIASAATL